MTTDGYDCTLTDEHGNVLAEGHFPDLSPQRHTNDPLLDTDHPDYGAPGVGAWPNDHRYSVDTDRCICGGTVVYFEPDDNGEFGEGCEVADEVWGPR